MTNKRVGVIPDERLGIAQKLVTMGRQKYKITSQVYVAENEDGK